MPSASSRDAADRLRWRYYANGCREEEPPLSTRCLPVLKMGAGIDNPQTTSSNQLVARPFRQCGIFHPHQRRGHNPVPAESGREHLRAPRGRRFWDDHDEASRGHGVQLRPFRVSARDASSRPRNQPRGEWYLLYNTLHTSIGILLFLTQPGKSFMVPSKPRRDTIDRCSVCVCCRCNFHDRQ